MDDIVFILEENTESEHPELDIELDVYAVVAVDVDGRYCIIQVLNEPDRTVLNDVSDIIPDYDAEEPPGIYVMKMTPVYDCHQSMYDTPEYEIEIDFTVIEDLNSFIFEEVDS